MADTVSDGAEIPVFSVDTLLNYMGNDAKALQIVSKIVRDACAPGLEPIQQAGLALEQDRLHDAGRIFHGVRGSVGTLGAKRMVNASLALEHAIAQQATEQIPALFANMMQEYTLVMEYAAAWLLRNKQPV